MLRIVSKVFDVMMHQPEQGLPSSFNFSRPISSLPFTTIWLQQTEKRMRAWLQLQRMKSPIWKANTIVWFNIWQPNCVWQCNSIKIEKTLDHLKHNELQSRLKRLLIILDTKTFYQRVRRTSKKVDDVIETASCRSLTSSDPCLCTVLMFSFCFNFISLFSTSCP